MPTNAVLKEKHTANYPKPVKGTRHNANTHYKSGVKAQLRKERREGAKLREVAYSNLSPAERLARLDAGGFKAQRQRDRIQAQQKAAKVAVEAEAKAEAVAQAKKGPKATKKALKAAKKAAHKAAR